MERETMVEEEGKTDATLATRDLEIALDQRHGPPSSTMGY